MTLIARVYLARLFFNDLESPVSCVQTFPCPRLVENGYQVEGNAGPLGIWTRCKMSETHIEEKR